MRRLPEALDGRPFDLLVVGGGVAGCFAAWDAALRGWSVALVERGDFGAATSGGCYRILHGGLRHLQSVDFPAMRESIRERRFFLRAAPHLCEPLPCLVPTRRGDGVKGRLGMGLALAVNDLVSRDRNLGVRDPSRHLPGGRVMSAAETLRLAPFIDPARLTGGAVFHDAVIYSTERLVYTVAEAAALAGAVVVNHLEVLPPRGQPRATMESIPVRDRISGAEFTVRAAQVLDCAGPWSGWWRAPPSVPGFYSAGVQLVTRPLDTSGHLLAFSTPAGKRYFAMPWRGVTVWGTADREYRGAPDAWRITDQDIEAFLAEINQALPAARLTRADVRHAFGGLRPPGSEASASGAAATADLRFAAEEGGPANLLRVTATKFTTARRLAERALDLLAPRLKPARPCQTASSALPGGDIPGLSGAFAHLRALAPPAVSDAALRDLLRLHGEDAQTLLAPDPNLTDALLLDRLRLHARRSESAETESDVERRLGRGNLG